LDSTSQKPTIGGAESAPPLPEDAAEPQSTWRSSAATTTLIAINTLIFLLMVAKGVSFISPTADSVLAWGADYGPRTLNGQWWRMFTSLFLHFGIIHLAFNMLVLANIGPFMESLSGRVSYLILYIVSGIGGGAASLAFHPTIVSAGASGAIFGLYGGLLGFLLRHRNVIPKETLQPLSKGALTFVGYNIIFGLRPGVDMAAHIGGLAAGFLLGLFLVQQRTQEESSQFGRNGAAVVLGAILLILPLQKLPKPGDFLGEFRRLAVTEDNSLALFNSSADKWKARQLSDQQFTDTIEQQILPQWRAERDAMAKLQNLPANQANITASVLKYMDARQESWQLLVDGVRTRDAEKIKQSTQKSHEADQLAAAVSGRKR
jgi:rhomboid protease GluP